MRLKKTYILYFTIILGLLLFNQAFIQYSLFRKQKDAKTINVAGRQRMLSQKLSLLYHVGSTDPLMADSIQRTYDLWATSHYALLEGNETIDLPAIQDKKARALLDELTPVIEENRKFVQEAAYWNSSAVALVTNKQTDFLYKMNQAVNFLEAEADRKLKFVKVIEVVLALIALLTLFFEFRYLVIPAQKAVEKKNKELDQFNSKLKEALFMQNHIIREPLTSLMLMLRMVQNEENEEKRALTLKHLNTVADKVDNSIKEASDFFNEIKEDSPEP